MFRFKLLFCLVISCCFKVSANTLDSCRLSLYNGNYAMANQYLVGLKSNNNSFLSYQKYMLFADFHYFTQNIENYKYYTDSAAMVLSKNKNIPQIYLAEIYRNYSKYHHFHAMPLYSVPYADSALVLINKYKSRLSLIDLHTIYFAKAAAERNHSRLISKIYFDSAFSTFSSTPYKKVELYRSYSNYFMDQLSVSKLSKSQKLYYYQLTISALDSSERILRTYHPKNRSQLGYIYLLKGLAAHLVGGKSQLAGRYFNSAIFFYETSNDASYSIISYITALNWQNLSNQVIPSITLLEEKNIQLKKIVPHWESWVNRNINSNTYTLKYIYSHSPLNLIATNYASLFKLTHATAFADSFFYYTEKVKGYFMVKSFSDSAHFSILSSIKQCQDRLKAGEAVVSYFGDYAAIDYALLIQKNSFHIMDLDRNYLRFNPVMTDFYCNILDFGAFKSFAHPLYVYLFKPIQLKLNKDITHLTISPSVSTGNVNFESLIEDTNATGFKQLNYLFKKYTFNYQVSLSLSDYLAKQQSNKNKALAFVPNYKNTTKNELPFLLKQADNLLKYNYKIYSGEQSSPTMFMLSSSNAKFIHIAGHSSLSIAYYGAQYSVLLNNKRGDLVKLSVSNIIKTKLNADMVVLALCETGAGDDLSGEANLNMAYYFTRAGAKSCVYGINKLEDKSAAFILDCFYDYLNQGLAKDDALHRAKLKYLEVERFDEEYSPIFWSSLAVQGNIKPIYFDAKNKPKVYLFLIAECIFSGLICLGLFGKKFTVK